MTMSGTPSRYKLLPRPRRAACQPCHTGMRSSRLYSCSAVDVVVLSLMAALAAVERRDYHPVDNAGQRERFADALAKIGPLCGLPQRSRCSSSRSASWRMTGTGARPLRVLGSFTRPFQIERETYISPF